MQYYLILAAAFFTVVFLVVGLHQLINASRQTVQERLKNYAPDEMLNPQFGEDAGLKARPVDMKGFLGMLGSMLPKRPGFKDLQQKLIQAQLLVKVEEYLGFKIFLAAALFLIAVLFGSLLAGLALGLIAYKLPDVYVNMRKGGRMNKLTEQLPEALGIISGGLRAGFSFPQAMAVVGKEMDAPIRDEFSRVLWENRMGKPMDEALRNLGDRTDCDDLDLFITALIIQRQVGGNLAEILDNISNTIRDRIMLKGEVKTLTAQGRFSAIIIILLPIGVATVVAIIDPRYLAPLITTSLGQALLVTAVILEVIGIFVIRKVIDIKY